MSAQTRFGGLTTKEAQHRLIEYGPNMRPQQKRFTVAGLIWQQFTSPMIYILVAAAAVTAYLGFTVDESEFVNAIVITLAIVINASLGFFQEFKAEKALEELENVFDPTAVVIRDSTRHEIPVSQIVPGDVCLISSGDRIPADGVLLTAQSCKVDEAVLTGESIPIEKKAHAQVSQLLSDRTDAKERLRRVQSLFVELEQRQAKAHAASAYAGTTVVSGNASLLVTSTGTQTQVGKIATSLHATTDDPTPLQQKLQKVSKSLAIIVGILTTTIFIIGLTTGETIIHMFTLSIAIAVSAIPEGLVISLTAILAVGMQRMLAKKALVRKLLAAEVLGSVTVICSDKTGTLTTGNLTLKGIKTNNQDSMYAAMLTAVDLKDSLENNIWTWVSQRLSSARRLHIEEEHQRLDRLPFTSSNKFSATLTQKSLFIIAAPEVILEKSDLSKKQADVWLERINQATSKGQRLVAIGYRPKGAKETKITKTGLAKPIKFLGLVFFEDEVRPHLTKVFAAVNKAGIAVKVITGDYAETARYVMKRLKLEPGKEEIMDGQELAAISPEDLDARIDTIKLFARTSPDQKLKIVESLKRRGEVVAMTGDGVNDAPAIKKSDIGLVVANASDVSKQTADVILLDSNFKTIVAAIEEGRSIIDNIKKVVLYLLSDSFSEVILVVGSLILGLPIPITAAQILWVNLANDSLPNLSLTLEPKAKNLLERQPIEQDAPLIDSRIKALIAVISLSTGLIALGLFAYLIHTGTDLATAQTISFTLLGVDSLLYVFSSRSLTRPVWQDSPMRNPWLVGAVIIGFGVQLSAVYVPFLQNLLGTVPLTLAHWEIIGMLSGVVIALIEITKYLFLHPIYKHHS